ncbi:MAG: hypothetical protein V3V35_02030 [Dehalococcoidia bacterium]
MFSLAVDYFLLVFLASSGVVQIAAAYSRIFGLLIVPDVRAGYLVGIALLAGAFTWFVAIGDQNIPGDLGGVEGSEQFGLFLAGTAASVVVTMVVASATQSRTLRGRQQRETGIEALRGGSLLAVVMDRWRRRRRHDRR